MSAKKILYLVAHPDLSRSIANKAIAAKIEATGLVRRHDLYTASPNGKLDVAKEQELLAWADLVVLQFPFQWYSAPGLLKEWQDQVLKYGFAFTLDGSPSKLRGKEVLVSLTSGGPKEAYGAAGYNRFSYAEMLRPLEQTFTLCQMKWLGHKAVGGMMVLSEADKQAAVAAGADDLAEFLRDYAAGK